MTNSPYAGKAASTWLSVTQQLVKDQNGNPLEVIGSWSEVTARKTAEQAALAESERRLTDAIAKQSPELLDELGLNVKLEDALKSQENGLSESAKADDLAAQVELLKWCEAEGRPAP